MKPDRRFRMEMIVLFLTVTCTASRVLAASQSQSSPSPSSIENKNEAVARRVFEEIFNQGRFQVADQIYAKDFVNRGQHRNFTLAEDQAAVHEEKKAFPDLRMTVDMMVAGGDLVTVVWTFRGTNSAAGYGLPATGAKVEVRGITVWRITDGLIREEWTSFNELVAARQMVGQLKWKLLGTLILATITAWLLLRLARRVLWATFIAGKRTTQGA
jgi:steroid delta-isomerase-like uncharacterized protein